PRPRLRREVLLMDELHVCVLTIRFHATQRHERASRAKIRAALKAATGEPDFRHALQVGQDLVKRSTNPLIAEYRKNKAKVENAKRRDTEASRGRESWENLQMLNDY